MMMRQKMMEKTTAMVEEFCQFMKEDQLPSEEEKKEYIDKMLPYLHMSHVNKYQDYTFLPPFFAETGLGGYNDWNPNPGDVLVSTFPKTGTTWTIEIVRQLLFKDDERMLKLSKMLATPPYHYLEDGAPEKHKFTSRLDMKKRVTGTHLPAEFVNVEKLKKSGAKIIYVTRNPKDTAESLHKFLHKLPFPDTVKGDWPTDVNEFTEYFMQGKLPMGSKPNEWYPHHIKQWIKYKNDESFLFIRFEDLKADPVKVITQIANFIGSGSTEEDILEVVKMTSFDAMKAAQIKQDGMTSSKMNKGQIGNWKNVLSEEVSAKMDKQLEKDLDGVDIEFVY